MSSTPGSPAVCEIDGCGVLAVGRCATCERAFCATHQARTGWDRSGVVDQCLSCQMVESEELANRLQTIEAARQYFISGSARSALAASGVPTTNILRRYTISKRTLFGGYQDEYRVRMSGYGSRQRTLFGGFQDVEMADNLRGWILGESDWVIVTRDRDGSSNREHMRSLTALLDEDSAATFVLIRPVSGGYEVNWAKDFTYAISIRGQDTGSFYSDHSTISNGDDWLALELAVKQLLDKAH